MPDRVPRYSGRERDHAPPISTQNIGATPDRSLHGLHILIVEDEYLIAAEIRAAVEGCGATAVGPAATLQQALSLAAGDISCAILDISLGRHSVGPVAQVLLHRRIPFMFYSAQPPTGPFLKDWPQIILVEKPASAATIIAALHSLVMA
jgi:hypothetical protein